MQDSAKPVTSISFPAVTICSEGLDLDAVTKVIAGEFKAWKTRRNLNTSSLEADKELLDRFVEEEYAIGKGENIFDFVRAMNSPNPDKSMAQSSVLGKVVACVKEEGEKEAKQRKKRNTASSSIVTLVYQEAGFAYYKVEVAAGLLVTKDTITNTCNSQGMKRVCNAGLDVEGEKVGCQRTTFMPDTPKFLASKIDQPENVFINNGGRPKALSGSRSNGESIKSGNPILFTVCVTSPGKY